MENQNQVQKIGKRSIAISQISTWMDCPLRATLERRDRGLTEKKGVHVKKLYGEIVEQAVTRMFVDHFNPPPGLYDDYKLYMPKTMRIKQPLLTDETTSSHGVLHSQISTAAGTLLENMPKILETMRLDGGGPHAVTSQASVKLSPDLECNLGLHGKIDILVRGKDDDYGDEMDDDVSNIYTVIEVKTGVRPRWAQWILQTLGYMYAAYRTLPGTECVYGYILYVPRVTMGNELNIVVWHVNPSAMPHEDIDNLMRKLDKALPPLLGVERDTLANPFSVGCSSCSYHGRADCPITFNLNNLKEIKSVN